MKKILIITSIASLLFIFGCAKVPEATDTINTWESLEQYIDDNTWDTQANTWNIDIQTWTNEVDLTWATSWDIKILIDDYKAKNTWDSDKLNENDIELMEKVIDKIEKK